MGLGNAEGADETGDGNGNILVSGCFWHSSLTLDEEMPFNPVKRSKIGLFNTSGLSMLSSWFLIHGKALRPTNCQMKQKWPWFSYQIWIIRRFENKRKIYLMLPL